MKMKHGWSLLVLAVGLLPMQGFADARDAQGRPLAAERHRVEAELESRLSELKSKLDALRQSLAGASDDAKVKLRKKISTLERKESDAEKKLSSMKKASK